MIKLKELIDKIIVCPKCKWSWKLCNGRDNPYICHKCRTIIKENIKHYISKLKNLE